MISKS